MSPETVQTAGEFEEKVTVSPELATAPIENGALPAATLPGVLKVMVCVPGATVKLIETLAAAPTLALPGLTGRDGAGSRRKNRSRRAETVQTLGVDELKLTGRPEDAEADKATGPEPTETPAIVRNVMVCDPRVTEKLWTTLGAAANVALPA